MAQKTTSTPAPVVDRSDRVRNVVLVGHSGAGKTALVEALLTASDAIWAPDRIADGTTVSLACSPLIHDGIKVNLLDTPGHADFAGELRAGLRAADAALFVVSAVDGMDTATAALWEECASAGMPRAVAVTRLDDHRADFDETVALCQRVFGDNVLPLYLPMLGDDGESVAGLLGLITARVFDYSGDAGVPGLHQIASRPGPVWVYPPVVRDPDPEHLPAIEESRGELLEGIIAESEDDTLMERYLDGEDIETDTIIADLEKAVAAGSFYPVIPVVATTGLGLDALLEVLTSAFPTPGEHDLPAVVGPDGSPREAITCDPAGPLVAEVVTTTGDPSVSLIRVFSGTLSPDVVVRIGTAERGGDERIAHVFTASGAGLHEVPYCVAGDICLITGSSVAEAGDTISAAAFPLLIAAREL